eukprot:TRINITY_DN18843_c0_g2_i1.p1 TRINITY_DN18843_c0_g2~~TRINITY_DN18843_c0_g2_i1.p1  ORF type:complete len:923 (-),score=140.57 TRINITY_DN18843_c0_g2_i1:643-3411(-)
MPADPQTLALLRNVGELVRFDVSLDSIAVLILAPQRNEDCFLLDEDDDGNDLALESLAAALSGAHWNEQSSDSPKQKGTRMTNVDLDAAAQGSLGVTTVKTMNRILQRIGSRCYEFRSTLSRGGEHIIRYHMIFDVGIFNSLNYSDTNALCQGMQDLLVPGGLVVVASEESEAYGVIRSRMRALRPAMEDRVLVKPLGNSSNSLHVYRKSLQDRSMEGEGGDDDDDLPPPLAQRCEQRQRGRQRHAQAPAMDVASFKQESGGREDAYKAFVRAMHGSRSSPEQINTSLSQRGGQEGGQETQGPQAAGRLRGRPEGPDEKIKAVWPDWVADSIDLAEISGCGRGLITRSGTQAGDLLFITNALFSAPAQHIGESVMEWLANPGTSRREKQLLYASYSGRDGDTNLPCHMSFYTGDAACEGGSGIQVPSAIDPDRVYRIFKLNAYQAESFDGAGSTTEGAHKSVMFSPMVALMNHSCCPTTIMVPLGGRTLACIAASHLPAGTELTGRYISLDMPYEERQSELQEAKEFSCKCGRCQAELSGMSTDAIKKLLTLRDALSMLEFASGSDVLPTLEKTASIFRQELHKASRDWFLRASPSPAGPDYGAGAAALFKASFLRVFSALAISYERSDDSVPECGGRRLNMAQSMQLERAWREVCDIHEQMEPCSEAHLQAAFRRLFAAEISQHDQALRYCFSIWLGRYGTTAVISKSSAAAVQLRNMRLRDFNAEDRAAAVIYFASFYSSLKRPVGSSPAEFPDAWLEQLNRCSEWTAALDILGSVGVWSCCWALRSSYGGLDKPADSRRRDESPSFGELAHTVDSPLMDTSAQPEAKLYEWEQLTSTSWRLKVYGMSKLSEIDLDLSDTRVHITYPRLAGCVEIDVCTSNGGPLCPILANEARARFMKQSKVRHRPYLQLDLSCKLQVK